MKTFELTWSDDTLATYPDVETDGRQKSYRFDVESEEDARAFVRSFAMINPEHNFTDYEVREVENNG